MTLKLKILSAITVSVFVIIVGVGIGNIFIRPHDIIKIIFCKLFNKEFIGIPETFVAIILKVRLPRVLMAFLIGGSLAVSGSVMQSVLKNPLASSYTMGVSSGAALGAACVIAFGFFIPTFPQLTLPFAGTVTGLLSVYAAVRFAFAVDKSFTNNTIILAGIVFSLFINGIITLIIALNRTGMAQLIFWQMGSFSTQRMQNFQILFPLVVLIIVFLLRYSVEMDILTFGETDAKMIGVDTNKTKWILLFLSAALTGSAVSFAGIIGFVDLIAPHLVRKIFGSKHKVVIPMSFFTGGILMTSCDIAARTLLTAQELPIGAITALIGAPVFCFIYFKNGKRHIEN